MEQVHDNGDLDSRQYWLGSVTSAELNNTIEELLNDLSDPTFADFERARSEVGHIADVSAVVHEERDAGAIILIAIGWVGSKIADKAFDVLVDEYLRPRLRAKFSGRDIKPSD